MLDAIIPRLRDLLSLTAPLAFVDVETTGVLPTDRIVQIAIIRLDPGGAIETFHTLVNPQRPIPAEATAVHGITDLDVVYCPTFGVLYSTLCQLLGNGAVLAAYNGRFDVKMMAGEFERIGQPNPIAGAPLIDPFTIFVRKQPRDLSAAVLRFTGKPLEDAHDAMADIVATVDVLAGQLAEYDDLPRDTQALATWCLPERDPSWLDPDGKVAWRDGDARLTFGKNAGRTLRDLARHDPSFLRWVLQKDFSDDVKHLVREAINGRFPPAPQPAQHAVEA